MDRLAKDERLARIGGKPIIKSGLRWALALVLVGLALLSFTYTLRADHFSSSFFAQKLVNNEIVVEHSSISNELQLAQVSPEPIESKLTSALVTPIASVTTVLKLPSQPTRHAVSSNSTGEAPSHGKPRPRADAHSNAKSPAKPVHPFPEAKYRIYPHDEADNSPRCRRSRICHWDHQCGPDSLGCITEATQRKERVREAARWTWKGYRQFAWGHDELNAGSKAPREWFRLGITVVDSLDTLILLGLDEEYAEARHWVQNYLVFEDTQVSVFETTIRVLGGLLAAFYHSGGDELYLGKAVEFGDLLLPSFSDQTHVPCPFFNLRNGCAGGRTTNIAEAGTLSVEFSTLSHVTGDPKYADAAMPFWERLSSWPNHDGLFCNFVNPMTGACTETKFSFGASADSAYEYMLKQWVLSARKDTICLEHYRRAITGMRHKMLSEIQVEGVGKIWVAAELQGTRRYRIQHLTCFLPGLLVLGHLNGINTADSPDDPDDLLVAARLMRGCYELYRQAASGVAYDTLDFHNKQFRGGGRRGGADGSEDLYRPAPVSFESFLRPEVTESLFYLWRATGDETYREWGWQMFRAYELHCRLPWGGYQVLQNVDSDPPRPGDKMESFWLAETLKYFFLLFEDDAAGVVPLDQFVFNTEAHPLPVWGSEMDAQVMAARAAYYNGKGGAVR